MRFDVGFALLLALVAIAAVLGRYWFWYSREQRRRNRGHRPRRFAWVGIGELRYPDRT